MINLIIRWFSAAWFQEKEGEIIQTKIHNSWRRRPRSSQWRVQYQQRSFKSNLFRLQRSRKVLVYFLDLILKLFHLFITIKLDCWMGLSLTKFIFNQNQIQFQASIQSRLTWEYFCKNVFKHWNQTEFVY